MKHISPKSDRGYILLLAVLIVSVILSISFSIYSLAIKEVQLSSFLNDSSKAFTASDVAAECALYWDRSFPQDGMRDTIFATSSDYVTDPNLSQATCDGIQLSTSNWVVSGLGAETGETDFTLNFANGTYANVVVVKSLAGETRITSDGYNTAANTDRKVMRTIEIDSNI